MVVTVPDPALDPLVHYDELEFLLLFAKIKKLDDITYYSKYGNRH